MRASPAEYLSLKLRAHELLSGIPLNVLPVSWLTRPYLIAIEPFRRFLLYPAMLRRIRRAWNAMYGASG